jgi:hypothetical protein
MVQYEIKGVEYVVGLYVYDLLFSYLMTLFE